MSTSHWGAPVLFAKKIDKTLQLCIDYQQLNRAERGPGKLQDISPHRLP